MWGRLLGIDQQLINNGNTPTHVGKTALSGQVTINNKKHPHACGEDTGSKAINPYMAETPPRMWGRLHRQAVKHPKVRNTPTHVGKTRLQTGQIKSARKHPHACGEDRNHHVLNRQCQETPPRMWGRPTECDSG